MTTQAKKPSRLTKALLESADDMHRARVLDTAAHRKITLRHLGDAPEPPVTPMTGAEIRRVREDQG